MRNSTDLRRGVIGSLNSALLVALLSRPCAAQAADAGPAHPGVAANTTDVQPPRLKVDSGAAYPQQALDEHFFSDTTVTLILDLDATGAVTRVSVDTLQGHGFDEAAAAAGAKLIFEPALRGGRAVASRIKFQYAFRAPSPQLTGRVLRQIGDSPIANAEVHVRDAAGADHVTPSAADGTWRIEDLPPGAVHVQVIAPGQKPFESDETVAPGEQTELVTRVAPVAPAERPKAGAKTDGPVVEVTVRGDRPPREVTKRTLSKDEITHIPGTNGDALISLQSMPGVARPPPFSGALVVRGSAPIDTNVFVDGTNIPLAFHFGAFSSVVPNELLEKIDFVPGNFSAAYGRGMGGIVDVGLRNPKHDRLHAIAQADLIDTRLLVEGPIAHTGWNFLVAGRRSWFDVWLTPLLSGSGIGITTAPRYYDYQAMLQKDLTERQSFRLLFFGSSDALAIINQSPNVSDPALGGALAAHTNFWRLQARYENRFTDRSALRTTLAYGQDFFDLGTPARFQRTTGHPLSARVEFSQKLGSHVTANVGVDAVYEPYDIRLRRSPPRKAGQPDLGATDTPVESTQSSNLFLPGLYADFELTPRPGTRIIPGVRADYDSGTSKWDFSPRLNVRQELKRSFPRTTLKGAVGLYYQPPSPIGVDIRSNQADSQPGLSSNRSIHYDVGVDQDLTTQLDLSLDTFYKSFSHLVVPGARNAGIGRAYGVECLLRYKADEHLFAWLSYTLSRSERRDLPGDAWRLFRYDQTHVLTALASYKLGRGWQLGGRFRLISGPLDTSSSYGPFDASAGAQLSVDQNPPYGTRLPLFDQLDIRADKQWDFATWKLSWYLDIQNVYSKQAAEGLSYNYNFTQSTYSSGLPILPSVGLRAEF